MSKTFSPGDKVAWAMPMDVYEGIVVRQHGDDVELLSIIGPNDEVHPVPFMRPAKFLTVVTAANRPA